MNNYNFSLICVTVIGLTSCNAPSDTEIHQADRYPFGHRVLVEGKIDRDFVNNALISAASGDGLEIKSSGGQSLFTIAFASSINNMVNIRSDDSILFINDYCLSACASYLILGLSEYEIGENVLIGYHYDLNWVRDYYVEQGGSQAECYSEHHQRLLSMYSQNNVNSRYFEQVRERLGVDRTTVVEGAGDCDEVYFETDHEMWFPTSAEFREYFGVDFSPGTLCADDHDCIAQKLRNLDPSRTYLVGEDVWSEGRQTQ